MEPTEQSNLPLDSESSGTKESNEDVTKDEMASVPKRVSLERKYLILGAVMFLLIIGFLLTLIIVLGNRNSAPLVSNNETVGTEKNTEESEPVAIDESSDDPDQGQTEEVEQPQEQVEPEPEPEPQPEPAWRSANVDNVNYKVPSDWTILECENTNVTYIGSSLENINITEDTVKPNCTYVGKIGDINILTNINDSSDDIPSKNNHNGNALTPYYTTKENITVAGIDAVKMAVTIEGGLEQGWYYYVYVDSKSTLFKLVKLNQLDVFDEFLDEIGFTSQFMLNFN